MATKPKYATPYTLGELIERLQDIAEVHGRHCPVGRIGHFGEVHHLDKYSVSFHGLQRDKYEVPDGDWRNKHRRDIPLLVEIECPDIGEEPD